MDDWTEADVSTVTQSQEHTWEGDDRGGGHVRWHTSMTRVRKNIDILCQTMDKKFEWRDTSLTVSFSKIREKVNEGLEGVLETATALTTQL